MEEIETQNNDAGNSSRGIIELTSAFQSLRELEAYTTKYKAHNKQAKVIIEFQENTELNLTTLLLKKTQEDANEGDNNLEKDSMVRQLFGESKCADATTP